MRTKSILIVLVLAAMTMLLPAAAATAGTTAPVPLATEKAERFADPTVQAAGSPVFNYRRLVLEFPADVGSEVCKARDIYLAAGWYYWRHEDWHSAGYYDERRIYLAAGWYHWKDCIGGFERASSDDHPYYHDTYLRQHSTGGYARLDRNWITNPHDGPVTVYSQFGSSLRQL